MTTPDERAFTSLTKSVNSLLFSMRLIWDHQISLGMVRTTPQLPFRRSDQATAANRFPSFRLVIPNNAYDDFDGIYFTRDSHISFESQIYFRVPEIFTYINKNNLSSVAINTLTTRSVWRGRIVAAITAIRLAVSPSLLVQGIRNGKARRHFKTCRQQLCLGWSWRPVDRPDSPKPFEISRG